MSPVRPLMSLLCSLALVLGMAAPVLAQDDPVDPDVAGAPLVYEPVMGSYDSTGLVGKPGNWKELNELAERLAGQKGQLEPLAKPMLSGGNVP